MLDPIQAHSHLIKLSVLTIFLKAFFKNHLLHIIKICGVPGTMIPISYALYASSLFLSCGKVLSYILIVPHKKKKKKGKMSKT